MTDDMISRQASLNLLDELLSVNGHSKSEIYVMRAVWYILKHLLFAELKRRWIPINERSPRDGYWFVTAKGDEA